MTAAPSTTNTTTPDADAPEPFAWTSSSGAVLTISRTTLPPSGYWRKARKLDELDAMYSLLETVATPEEVEATDELDPTEVIELMSAWTKFVSGGATPGESASSSS